jgi:hypothetical protein
MFCVNSLFLMFPKSVSNIAYTFCTTYELVNLVQYILICHDYFYVFLYFSVSSRLWAAQYNLGTVSVSSFHSYNFKCALLFV